MPTAPTTILLVRHADVHNPGRVFYGRLPRFGLSALGRRQARFLGEHLSTEPIAAFYTSPMLRARQTAAILAERHPRTPVRRASPLLEVRTAWMGTVEHQMPAPINLYEPPLSSDDETIADIWHRVSHFIERLARRHVGQVVCAVTHGDPVVIAHAGYLGMPLTLASIRGSFYPQKCSVTRLTFDRSGAPRLSYQDVIGELAPELKAPF